MKPHQQSQKNIGGDIMTDVEEIKDKIIEIIWEKTLSEEDLDYIFESVKDEWRCNQ